MCSSLVRFWDLKTALRDAVSADADLIYVGSIDSGPAGELCGCCGSPARYLIPQNSSSSSGGFLLHDCENFAEGSFEALEDRAGHSTRSDHRVTAHN